MPGGGMPRGGGDVDTTKLYETLEVDKDADAKEIKKAYRRLSRTHHPDKGGDEHKFKEINAAYEILSDPDKRKQYDKYGLEGVDDGGAAAHGGEDLFSMFFGGSGRRGSAGPRKGPSVNHPLKVSLEDLYNGKTVKLAINRKVIVGDVSECTKCHGQGAIMEMRQIGPGMITQMQRTCDACSGQGNKAETKTERKVLEVHIDKGSKHGQRITFRGEADEIPGMETGDINFIVQEKEHELFKRKGADLLVTKDLSLKQALCGFTWKIKQLDGRELLIKTRPGEVIQAELKDDEGRTLPFIKMVKDEGMPSLGNPFVKGDLYIAFHVKFPETLPKETIEQLKLILPGDDEMEEEYDADKVEEHFMDPADLRRFGKGGAATTGGEYDSDDEEGGGGGVQCQQS
jgi:DnaJ family protein A protein 2